LQELVGAYVVRTDLEVLGARLAICNITDANLDELEGLAEQMREAARAGDRHALATADASFHGRIIELAGNTTLLRLWSSLEPLLRTYLTLVVPGPDLLWSAHLHDPILEALQRHDKRAAAQALRRHFASARSMVVRFWAEQQPPSTGVRKGRGKLTPNLLKGGISTPQIGDP
jgi:DNA-binding GntR family transcriptional regulator